MKKTIFWIATALLMLGVIGYVIYDVAGEEAEPATEVVDSCSIDSVR